MLTSSKPEDFNLIDSPWITVKKLNHEELTLSLKETLAQAGSIRALAHEDALMDTAILGVLQVCFMRGHLAKIAQTQAIDTFRPTSWIKEQLKTETASQQPVLDYLNIPEIKERFNLFDKTRPFMQVADLQTSNGQSKPISTIIYDSNSDHFSMRASKGKESISYAEAACRLITAQAYDYSGIKSGALGDPRVKGGRGYPIGTGWYGNTGKIIIHGQNLLETLIFNSPIASMFALAYDATANPYYALFDDAPVWERSPDTSSSRNSEGDPVTPTGPCDVLTWQSRRIRLIPNRGRVESVLVCNGDKISDRFIDAANRYDPWTGYRYSKNQSSKTQEVWMPLHHSPERTLWRGLEALITLKDQSEGSQQPKKPETISQLGKYFPAEHPIKVQLVGAVYGTQNALIEGSINQILPLELASLSENYPEHQSCILESARKTMDAAVLLGQYAGQLLRAAGAEYSFQPKPTEAVLHRLENDFRSWLASISSQQSTEENKKSWQLIASAVLSQEIERLAAGAGRKAAIGTIDSTGKLLNTATAQGYAYRSLKKIFPLAYPKPAAKEASQ